MDTPLDNPDMEIFTDGSSFVRDGKRKAGYTVVTAEQVLAKSLPQGTNAQLAELVALTQALELNKGQQVNIYTDFKYAYLALHAHAAIWKERQFKTATGEPIKHFREIERLLTAIYYPKVVAVMHCKGHSRDGSKVAEGNQLADCQARKVALYETPSLQTPLIWTGPVEQEKP